MNIELPMQPEEIKSLYEALGALQAQITDLEDFEHRDEWRSDYREWKYDPDCHCTRCTHCERFRQSTVDEGVYGKI